MASKEFTIFGWTPYQIGLLFFIGLCVKLVQKYRIQYFRNTYNVYEPFYSGKGGAVRNISVLGLKSTGTM
jgi:hypothetical protein